MTLDGLACVLRTGRVKAAGRHKQRRHPPLVQSDHLDAERSHARLESEPNNPSCFSALTQTSTNRGNGVARASRRGNTKNARWLTNCRRNWRARARKRRFARFLATAIPNREPTTTQTRGFSSSVPQDMIVNSGVRYRRPSRLTRSISRRLRMNSRRSRFNGVALRPSSHRQPVATFRAASSQDLPPALRLHAPAESMVPLSLQIGRLLRGERHQALSLQFTKPVNYRGQHLDLSISLALYQLVRRTVRHQSAPFAFSSPAELK